jgi:hypothetical protein
MSVFIGLLAWLGIGAIILLIARRMCEGEIEDLIAKSPCNPTSVYFCAILVWPILLYAMINGGTE